MSFADAHLPPVESQLSIERRGHDLVLTVLRDALGADAVADLMADGALMTQEQAVATAAEI